MDISYTYMEGRMDGSRLCFHGRSKERRNDSKVVVTAEMETADGDKVRVRQNTEAEDELAVIYSLLEINADPIGKVKSVVHPNPPPKKPPIENQGVP